MSRTADDRGGREERKERESVDDSRAGNGEHNRDGRSKEDDSTDRHSHRHRDKIDASADDSDERSSRHKHSSRSQRSKRTRDDESGSDDDRRERKHKKHRKDKHKHKHRRSDERVELDQRIQHTKQQLALLSSATSSTDSSLRPVLTADDYYTRSAEFRLWLHNTRAQHLDELSADTARQLFADFCRDWNGGRLPAVYYAGVDSSALSGSVLTGHRWGFVGAMSEAERMEHASVRDSVDTATYHHTYRQEFTAAPAKPPTGPSAAPTPAAAAAVPPVPRPFAALSKGDKRTHMQRVEGMLDEIAPRETGREAMLLKRREKGEYSRRERGGDGMEEMDDDVLLGGVGGSSELARLKERDSARREKRNSDQAVKRSEWDAKEKERMRAMLQSIGQADKYNI